MNNTLLAFENIHFGYDPQHKAVLEELNLAVEPNTVTAILGPNGAGKTTLLHLALGWLRPRRGRILLAGKETSLYSRRELGRWLGLVPQTEHVPFEFSLLEYTVLGRAPYLKTLEMPGEEDCQIAVRALQRVGLTSLLERSVTNLSGGELQLVMVARALAQQPRILLLDEPTAHLDLSNKIRLVNLLQELAASGVTILLTTHEPEVAAATGTHLVLMRSGKILHQGPIQETLNDTYLSETYQVPVKVHQIEGKPVILWV